MTERTDGRGRTLPAVDLRGGGPTGDLENELTISITHKGEREGGREREREREAAMLGILFRKERKKERALARQRGGRLDR